MNKVGKLGISWVALLLLAAPAWAIGPWTASASNPVITDDWTLGYNDPDVVKAGTTYVMYFTHAFSDPNNPNASGIYRATSTNGTSWTLDPNIRVAPASTLSAWDGVKTETPNLVYFNNKWHMYYCGIGSNGIYQIGHATSTDLYTWTKDSLNPLLTPSSITDGSMVLHVCEPGAVIFNSRIYLFFVVTKARPASDNGGFPAGKIDIYLAQSVGTSGSGFTTPVKVLSQGSRYPASSGYAGYSTVNVQVNGGTLHLFHDVYWNNGNPGETDPWDGYYQVAIEHAQSTNGTSWVEDTAPIWKRDMFTWTAREMRSPSVIRDGTLWTMWFAGDNVSTVTWTGQMGIGYATAPP